MDKPRSLDLAAVRSVRAVRDEIHTKLALWRFNYSVGFTGRYRIALAIQLEVVNQCLHALLHVCTRWGCNLNDNNMINYVSLRPYSAKCEIHLPIVDLDNASRYLVNALIDNSK